MSDAIDDAIRDIAVKHGVVLGKDDPILMLQTMNERLLKEHREAQQEMLVQFLEEMESISSQWKVDANDKAEKVLNTALSSTKESMCKLLKHSANDSINAINQLMSNSISDSRALTMQINNCNKLLKWSNSLMISMVCLIMLLLASTYL